MIDAGIGNEKLSDKQCRNYGVEYESLMNEDLQDLGLTTTDIDMVLMTHLHHDHACGLTDKEVNAIFSQATYWKDNQGDYSQRLILFSDSIEPYPGINMIHTGGHSMITIESKGEKAVHMSDIFSTTAHLNPLWVAAYEDYPMKSIREKERLIPYFIQNQYWFLFYHDENYFAVKYQEDRKTIETFISR